MSLLIALVKLCLRGLMRAKLMHNDHGGGGGGGGGGGIGAFEEQAQQSRG